MASLVTIRPPTEVAPFSKGEIASCIADLEIAFPAGATCSIDDRLRYFALALEACSKVEPFAAVVALRSLAFDNPRNPFPPTVQDVLSRCKDAEAAIKRSVHAWACKGTWCRAAWARLDGLGLGAGPEFPLGAEPYQSGAIVPAEFVSRYIRDVCAGLMQNRLSGSRDWPPVSIRDLKSMPDPRRLPPDAIPDGYATAFEAHRSQAVETAEREAARAKAETERWEAEQQRDAARRLEKYGRMATPAEHAAFLDELVF